MPSASPCTLVIFGASGDLAKRKLIPAIYEMMREKLLPDEFVLIGYARSPMSDQQYRDECRDAVQKFARTKPVDPAVWKKIEQNIAYVQGDYGKIEDFRRLEQTLAKFDKEKGTGGNRMFYLSTPPNTFEPIITCLGDVQKEMKSPGWVRIIIEKPFGRDLASAKSLNALLHKSLAEDQIFRIDHYLGKETVQNLMVMRFGNAIFEPLWNYKYIDHVQITVERNARGGNARRLLRQKRRPARHGAESHVSVNGAGGDGTAGGAGCGEHSR